MFRHRQMKRSRGQALVEFALAATLIFTLLSATVDLGMIFFTMQALRTAAQEGATFGSHPKTNMSANGVTITSVDLDYAEIVNRVRLSGGSTSGGVADLLDLNNDGINDSTQTSTVLNYADPNAYIYIQNLKYGNDVLVDPSTGLDVAPGTCLTTTANQDMRNAGKYCYVKVTVSYNYQFIFPLAPAFGNTIRLKTSFMIHVRSSFIG